MQPASRQPAPHACCAKITNAVANKNVHQVQKTSYSNSLYSGIFVFKYAKHDAQLSIALFCTLEGFRECLLNGLDTCEILVTTFPTASTPCTTIQDHRPIINNTEVPAHAQCDNITPRQHDQSIRTTTVDIQKTSLTVMINYVKMQPPSFRACLHAAWQTINRTLPSQFLQGRGSTAEHSSPTAPLGQSVALRGMSQRTHP